MSLTPEQTQQVRTQLLKHERPDGIYAIPLDAGNRDFLELHISRGVFGSDIVSSGIYMARYLHDNSSLFLGKDAHDMGCGPGSLGLLMALRGAASVDLADINPRAVSDTQSNISRLSLTNVRVFHSDLFSNVPPRRYQVITFNHPFFPELPENFGPEFDVDLMRSMLGGVDVLPKFFDQIPGRLTEDGILIMPYFHFAGPQNNPATLLSRTPFQIIKEEHVDSETGLQLGDFSIFEIGWK